jgi:hypothetical protein
MVDCVMKVITLMLSSVLAKRTSKRCAALALLICSSPACAYTGFGVEIINGI